ncbi:putative F-box domain, leucine-rich repeat domain superfamily, F-box-like domain superfamily [Helianthus anomalus]
MYACMHLNLVFHLLCECVSEVTMASTSNPRKRKIVLVPNPKQQPQPQTTRNLLELPSDLMVNILQRIGVVDILENAQKVCTAWREICKDPAMWTVVSMVCFSGQSRPTCQEMCKHVVDRSQGQLYVAERYEFLLFSIFTNCFCQLEWLGATLLVFKSNLVIRPLCFFSVNKSSQLRRLEIVYYFGQTLSEALKKLSLLEELILVNIKMSQKDIEVVGCNCPLLKTLVLNEKAFGLSDAEEDVVAVAIGKNLPNLTHLELIGNSMTNVGLQAILDGCCHLESLDLSRCFNFDLKGALRKRCLRHIRCFKAPDDSLAGCQYPQMYPDLDDDDDDYDYCDPPGVNDYDYVPSD